MTTEEERRERLEETDRKLTELKATVDNMIQHQDEQLAKMREDAKKRDRLDDEDLNGDGG